MHFQNLSVDLQNAASTETFPLEPVSKIKFWVINVPRGLNVSVTVNCECVKLVSGRNSAQDAVTQSRFKCLREVGFTHAFLYTGGL